ncbi:MAG: hypothetical protein ACR2QE_12100 [Acidimicrobiales bacterium]
MSAGQVMLLVTVTGCRQLFRMGNGDEQANDDGGHRISGGPDVRARGVWRRVSHFQDGMVDTLTVT